MFEIGFSEILVIAIVAVIVVGPERLPKTVRTVAHLLGRAQRYVSDIKSDIQRELQAEEIRNLRQSIQDVGKDMETAVRSTVDDVKNEAQSFGDSVKKAGDELNALTRDDKTTDEKPAESPASDATPVAEDAAKSEEKPKDSAKTPTITTKAAPFAAVPASLLGDVPLSIPDDVLASADLPATDSADETYHAEESSFDDGTFDIADAHAVVETPEDDAKETAVAAAKPASDGDAQASQSSLFSDAASDETPRPASPNSLS
jgi:sec-independent protein translocase protein TatB